MLSPRVIPCLLLDYDRLVKTSGFAAPVYLGDPLHAVRIFQEKGAGELMILDRSASKLGPSFALLHTLARHCRLPLTYGGGIRSLEDMKQLCALGIDKVSLNTLAHTDPACVSRAAALFGSQSIVVSIDVRLEKDGTYRVYTHNGHRRTAHDPVSYARRMQEAGAGELLLQSIDRDGAMHGYDRELIRSVSAAVTIPVIAVGGAGTVDHVSEALRAGASAAAAGSLFVFCGDKKAVLLNFPSRFARV